MPERQAGRSPAQRRAARRPARSHFRFRCRRRVTPPRVGAYLLEVLTPTLDRHLRLQQRAEDLVIRKLISPFPVNRIHEAVLPRTARFAMDKLIGVPIDQKHTLACIGVPINDPFATRALSVLV